MLDHETTTKNAAVDAVVDLIDAGAGAGDLQLLTAADGVLLTKALAAVAFGDAAAGQAALADTPLSASAAAGGTVGKFRFRNGSEARIFGGTAGPSVAIGGVSTGNRTFTVAGDYSAVLTAGAQIRITGSTGNDGWYTVVSTVYGAPNTTITVVEAVPDATVDGTLHPYDLTIDNPALVVGQNVSIASYTYRGPAN